MKRILRVSMFLLIALTIAFAQAPRKRQPKWLSRGPGLGGRLSAIVADLNDPQKLLVASPGGGVWRTLDGGSSWSQPLNYALADFSVVHLEWDRVRSGRLYASTYSDIYATTDFGDHWENLTKSGAYPAPLMPGSHVSDPKPFDQLMHGTTAATVFWARPCSGLHYSSDGSSFSRHWPFSGQSSNPDNCLSVIAADQSTKRVYIATMERGGGAHLFRSTCAWTSANPCLTWESANSGLPSNSVVAGLVWGGSANRLAAALDVSGSTQVYVTTDGLNWSPAGSQPGNPNWDPRPFSRPTGNQLLLGAVVAYQSTDWGANWSQVWYSGMHPDIRAFYWAAFSDAHYLWATTDGTQNSGVYANISRFNFTPGSAPSGGTTVGVSGLKAWQPYVMAVTGNPRSARRRIFLGALDNGALCSDDGGVTWTTSGTPPGGGCSDYPSIVIAPNDPDRAYSRTCSSTELAVSRNAFSASTCAEVSWTSVTPAQGHYTPHLWTNSMTAVDPTNADIVYFARGQDIAVSRRAGTSWTIRALPDDARPVTVFVDGAGAVYAGTSGKGIYRSTDQGATWTQFGLNSGSPKAVLKIALSSLPKGGDTWFAATTDGLYRKLPGQTFTRQTPDPSYTVSDVEVDPHCPRRVYIAMGYAGNHGQHRGGVLVSRDNGSTFTSLTSGLPIHQAPITDIQVDPVTPRYLHAAVFGLGAWTFDAGTTPSCP